AVAIRLNTADGKVVAILATEPIIIVIVALRRRCFSHERVTLSAPAYQPSLFDKQKAGIKPERWCGRRLWFVYLILGLLQQVVYGGLKTSYHLDNSCIGDRSNQCSATGTLVSMAGYGFAINERGCITADNDR